MKSTSADCNPVKTEKSPSFRNAVIARAAGDQRLLLTARPQHYLTFCFQLEN